MIESTVEFQYRHDILRSIVAAFCSLPEGLRPTHHSLGEDEPGDEIRDAQKFIDSLDGAKLGPFLRGPGITYDIRFAGTKPIICNCFLEVEPDLAKEFLIHMASMNPIFGFACDSGEREQRNRIVVKQGINTIESWVGRDPQKYVPGFYWLTLLPEALAAKHGIQLSDVEKAAEEHIMLDGGQHLFRFYERPEDWKITEKVAQVCSSIPGAFDIEKIRPEIMTAETYQELDALLSKWT